jgi:hypothetical protein
MAEVSSMTEPHVLWGALAVTGIAVIALLGHWSGRLLVVALIVLALIGVGIGTDVVAHGYQH